MSKRSSPPATFEAPWGFIYGFSEYAPPAKLLLENANQKMLLSEHRATVAQLLRNAYQCSAEKIAVSGYLRNMYERSGSAAEERRTSPPVMAEQ